MTPEALWAVITEMAGHVAILNREMGMVVARLDWVEWWIKTIVGGTILNAVMNVAGLWLSYKGNRNNKNNKNNKE